MHESILTIERTNIGEPLLCYHFLSYEEWTKLHSLMVTNANTEFHRVRGQARAHLREADPIRRVAKVIVCNAEMLDSFIGSIQNAMPVKMVDLN